MKEFFIQVRNMALIVAAAAFIGLILMLAAYSVPNEKIYSNVKASVDIYRIEHDHFFWGRIRQTDVDNFTNCVMLIEAVYPSEKGLIDSALVNRMWGLGEHNSPSEILINAMDTDRRADENDEWKYGRYWHGYLVFLKPLLYKMTVGNIRVLNSYAQLMLLAIAAALLYKRLGIWYLASFILAVSAINPVTTALCFQNSTMLYVTLFGVISVLLLNERLIENKFYVYYFLILGILTAFFDFLTYPFVSFGVPLCLFVILNREKFFTDELKSAFKKIFYCGFGWFFGYIGMWGSKWILATSLTEYNAIKDAFYNAVFSKLSSFKIDVSNASEDIGVLDFIKFLLFSKQDSLPQGYSVSQEFTVWDVFQKNLVMLSEPSFRLFFVLFLGILVGRIIYKVAVRKEQIFISLSMICTFLFITALPFIWYAAIVKHSYIHDFLVFKELAIAIFSISCFLVVLGDEEL